MNRKCDFKSQTYTVHVHTNFTRGLQENITWKSVCSCCRRPCVLWKDKDEEGAEGHVWQLFTWLKSCWTDKWMAWGAFKNESTLNPQTLTQQQQQQSAASSFSKNKWNLLYLLKLGWKTVPGIEINSEKHTKKQALRLKVILPEEKSKIARMWRTC